MAEAGGEAGVSARGLAQGRPGPELTSGRPPLPPQGDVWICMELMDTSLDKFYRKVLEKGMTIPEDILGEIAVSVSGLRAGVGAGRAGSSRSIARGPGLAQQAQSPV